MAAISNPRFPLRNCCGSCGMQVCEGDQKLYKAVERCAKCKIVPYCSKEHQRSHWPEHKKVCQSYAQEVNKLKSETTLFVDSQLRLAQIAEGLDSIFKDDLREQVLELLDLANIRDNLDLLQERREKITVFLPDLQGKITELSRLCDEAQHIPDRQVPRLYQQLLDLQDDYSKLLDRLVGINREIPSMILRLTSQALSK